MATIFRLLLHRRQMFSTAGGAALLVGSLGLAGCGNMSLNTTEARVRFAVVSADAPALDVYLNGTGAAYNLGYATYSSYVPVGAGASQFSANRASTGQALTSGRATLLGGHQYTAVVGNRLGDLREHIYTDALPGTVPGTIAVRILNEVDGGPIDVYLVQGAAMPASAAPVATNLIYGANAGYARVPANASYTIFVAPAGSAPNGGAAVKVSGANVSGGSGTARTLILTEAAKEGRGLYGLLLEDAETQ